MKVNLPLRIFCLLLCCIGANVVKADTSEAEALNLLRNMTQSFSTLSYDGVFVHSEALNMNSMRIRHDLMAGVEYESLEDLDGDKVEVLRIQDNVISVYPNALLTNRRTPLPPMFNRFKNVESERLLKGYDMIVEPKTSRIAGRDAVSVRLVPRDNYRYGHQFWLDKDNHFLLKHDMMKTDGQLLERIQFTSVNFDPDLKQEDFVPKKDSYSEPVLDAQPRRVKNLWQFDWLPDGFALVWPEARSLDEGTSMLLLSDGMTSVSVFVEPTMKAKKLSILDMGATIAGERSINVNEHLYLLTMVGEVPEPTIERLMMAIVPRVDHD
ncbi:MucB/RseB C-terminal domain-containing protein [Marinomonas sp. A79]|uniref:MucB/RseB C-terminal domain-containing protein n=1 Tax=Marinomonas vulgaris TaxID=2823372 RepID=A0ABS5HCS0_9GAMM|nr:MucB/RseB C-terminal domain-containing protein [Marinomonas vulgaris]MBR7889445.1 MucB/RseB C-terminal domain-containing protein [Marinomonas vulgaris]